MNCTQIHESREPAYTSWGDNYFCYSVIPSFVGYGSYPDEEETGYSPEFQGLTHDNDHWFLANNGPDKCCARLWKIPVSQDLRHVNSPSHPGIITRALADTSLGGQGYYHFGDLSYFDGFVVAPVENNAGRPHALAFFRGSDLQYVLKFDMPGYKDLGWVAIDPKGFVYTSGDFTTEINKYWVDWEFVKNPTRRTTASIQSNPPFKWQTKITLRDQDGALLELSHTQGGVFSEHGRLLYMLAGIHDNLYKNDGINVFDTRTWRRIIKSTVADEVPNPLHYHYHPGWSQYEEPEGITIWNLDDGRAPSIRGQLHVGMLDNESGDDDEVYLHHYGVVPGN